MSEEHPDSTNWGMTRKEREERKHQIFKLRRQGLTYGAIAEIVGVNASRVSAIHKACETRNRKKRKGSSPFWVNK